MRVARWQDTTAAIAQMAVGLTQSMLDEKPPDDGHRLNILSSAFSHVGISVFRDSSGNRLDDPGLLELSGRPGCRDRPT